MSGIPFANSSPDPVRVCIVVTSNPVTLDGILMVIDRLDDNVEVALIFLVRVSYENTICPFKKFVQNDPEGCNAFVVLMNVFIAVTTSEGVSYIPKGIVKSRFIVWVPSLATNTNRVWCTV